MAYINIINEADATDFLKETYDQIAEKRGKVGNIMKIHSLNPASMQAHFDLYLAIMFNQNGIIRVDRELVAVAVSVANDCTYCVKHHAEALNFYWKDDARLERFIGDPIDAELSEKQLAMVVYATKLTNDPSHIDASDVKQLKQVGLTDEDVLNLNLITSYFNFVNRIALGLGVEFSPEEVAGYKY